MDVDNLLMQRMSGVTYTHRFYNVLNGVAAELSDEALQYVRTERVPLLFNTVSNRKNSTN